MSVLFWYFLFYSFLGYLLEKVFAFFTRSPHQVRRCFLLLPLCPVYGLGMLAVLAAPKGVLSSPLLPLWGAAAATGVEYAVHWWYESFLGVRFWDYRGQAGNLRGRVCLPFSLVWGLLTAAAVVWVQPFAAPFLASMPLWLTAGLFAVLLLDGAVSAWVLAYTGDIDALGFYPPRKP